MAGLLPLVGIFCFSKAGYTRRFPFSATLFRLVRVAFAVVLFRSFSISAMLRKPRKPERRFPLSPLRPFTQGRFLTSGHPQILIAEFGRGLCLVSMAMISRRAFILSAYVRYVPFNHAFRFPDAAPA